MLKVRKITPENKGLTPKRPQMQRNPRVKHRFKFERARRKGAVREARSETKQYAEMAKETTLEKQLNQLPLL